MRQRIVTAVIVAIAVAVGLSVAGVARLYNSERLAAARKAAGEKFRDEWTPRLNACKTMADVKRLPGEDRAGIRVFDDGSWIAIVWHCAHDGGGLYDEWDSAVLKTSDGRLFWTDHHFCGGEGFLSEFMGVKAASLVQFFKNINFRLTRVAVKVPSNISGGSANGAVSR